MTGSMSGSETLPCLELNATAPGLNLWSTITYGFMMRDYRAYHIFNMSDVVPDDLDTTLFYQVEFLEHMRGLDGSIVDGMYVF